MSRVLPILFNGDMVRALLDGRKTVTRRCIKDAPEDTYRFGFDTFGKGYCAIDKEGHALRYVKPPYQPGDILYVRET